MLNNFKDLNSNSNSSKILFRTCKIMMKRLMEEDTITNPNSFTHIYQF